MNVVPHKCVEKLNGSEKRFMRHELKRFYNSKTKISFNGLCNKKYYFININNNVMKNIKGKQYDFHG